MNAILKALLFPLAAALGLALAQQWGEIAVDPKWVWRLWVSVAALGGGSVVCTMILGVFFLSGFRLAKGNNPGNGERRDGYAVLQGGFDGLRHTVEQFTEHRFPDFERRMYDEISALRENIASAHRRIDRIEEQR